MKPDISFGAVNVYARWCEHNARLVPPESWIKDSLLTIAAQLRELRNTIDDMVEIAASHDTQPRIAPEDDLAAHCTQQGYLDARDQIVEALIKRAGGHE